MQWTCLYRLWIFWLKIFARLFGNNEVCCQWSVCSTLLKPRRCLIFSLWETKHPYWPESRRRRQRWMGNYVWWDTKNDYVVVVETQRTMTSSINRKALTVLQSTSSVAYCAVVATASNGSAASRPVISRSVRSCIEDLGCWSLRPLIRVYFLNHRFVWVCESGNSSCYRESKYCTVCAKLNNFLLLVTLTFSSRRWQRFHVLFI